MCVFNVGVVDMNADTYEGTQPHKYCHSVSEAHNKSAWRPDLSRGNTSHLWCYRWSV